MNWKQTFIIGIISSLLSSISSLLYMKIYSISLFVDFTKVLGITNIISSTIFGCFIMVIGYKYFIRWKGLKSIAWLNLIYCILSFVSIIGVFGFNLPLEIEFPELFPGLAIPMHFFPLLSLLAIFPFFDLTQKNI